MDDELLSVFKTELRAAQRQRKTDEMLMWMTRHWSLFCSSKRQLTLIQEELKQRGDLSVSALLEALGVSKSVVFKKVNAVTAAELLLNPGRSELLKTFTKAVDDRRVAGKSEPLLCLFAIAGDHSLVVTNMDVQQLCGHSRTVVDATAEAAAITMFSAEDAGRRLPALFNR